MSAWAKPGVKVVCVRPIESLVKGEVYTIERLLRRDDSGRLGVVLIECKSAIKWTNTEGGFRLSRFRPLITRTQEDDVRLIKSLLVGDEVDA